jgi:hypothetical protein
MGDQSIMKKLLIIIPFCLTVVYADLSVQQIEQMINRIHLKREGIALETLEKTKEPFVRITKDENNTVVVSVPQEMEEDIKLSLHAIMSGRAYINDGWKKVDDTVMGYTIKYIGKKGVVLQNGNTIKKLFLGKPKESFIILEERE